MKKIKKSKLTFEKISVLEFKKLLSIKGGVNGGPETNGPGNGSSNFCGNPGTDDNF